MSDFRFKISGNSTPFLAELYNATTNSKVASQVVEYSGICDDIIPNNYTCVIFGGLSDDVSYYAKITDNIGNTTQSLTGRTPQDTDPEPMNITVDLLGDYFSPSEREESLGGNPTSDICVVRSPNRIDITPEPQAGENVTVCLNAIASASTNSTAYIDIYKKPNPTASYSKIQNIQNERDENIEITIGEGETVCYDLYTEIPLLFEPNQLFKYACTKLELDGATPSYTTNFTSGSTQSILNISEERTRTTTTTSTSSPTVVVYLNNFDSDTGTYLRSNNADLATDPPLNNTQSFRLYFDIINYYDIPTGLPSDICECGAVKDGLITCAENETQKRLLNNQIETFTENGYVDVDEQNIEDSCFKS